MNQTIAHKLTTAWNSADIGAISALYAANARLQHPMSPQPVEGRAAIGQLEAGLFAAFDQVEWTASQLLQQGNDVAVEFRVTARHSAPLPTPRGEVPATHRKVDVRGVSLLKLAASGEILEERRYFDIAGMMAQLGLG